MYYLYAEDTRDGAIHPLAQMRSKRFSRAMREAEKMEKSRGGARYFIAKRQPETLFTDTNKPDMATAAYLGVRRKPAPVGSRENQEHQRQTLRRQKPSARSGKIVDWDTPDPASGETLGEIYVDLIRRDLNRKTQA